MELRDIRYYMRVAEHQNIGRAAETLGLSATALSKSLRRLEKSVGAKLVRRAPHGIALTAVGSALLARTGALQGLLTDVHNEATALAFGDTGHISIGVSQGTAEHLLAEALVSPSRETSNVTLKVIVGLGAPLAKALRKGELDFCIGARHAFAPADFVFERLYDDPYVVFASASHRLAKRSRVSLADLVGERWASINNVESPQWQQLFSAMVSHGFAPPKMALVADSLAVRTTAIAYSDYLGMCARQYLQREARNFPLVELRIKEMVYVRHTSVIYRKDGYLAPAASRLIEILKQMAAGKPRSLK